MAKKAWATAPQQHLIDQIFEDFLERMKKDPSVQASVVDRLQETLMEQQEVSVDKLKQALFKEDPLQ